MLTSYWVTCPNLGCHWTGSLLPAQSADSWRSSIPTATIAKFECPSCHSEWRAHVHGDDIEPILEDELVTQ
jgi:hypothetical protein